MNSSARTKFYSTHHEVLLTWPKEFSRDMVQKILEYLKLPHLQDRCLYVSEIKKITAMYLRFDSNEDGFYRMYFNLKSRGKGANLLNKLGLPKWDTCLKESEIQSKLDKMFNAVDIRVHGDPLA